MYFVLQTPSLEHLVGVKIVATLWNQGDNLTQIAQSFNGLPGFYIKGDRKEWKAIEDLITSKIAALPLPKLYKDRLCNLIKPLGREIIDWCRYHSGDNKYNFLGNLLPRQFAWTMHGIIDYAKTAELMVKNERLNMHRRLEFACINCLEEEALELIELVPKDRRQEYFVNTLKNVMRDDFYHLIVLVSSVVNADGVDMGNKWNPFNPGKSFNNKYLLEDHLPSGNRSMCEYLFTILHQGEKEQVLQDCQKLIHSCREAPTRSLLYYLSLMSEEQQYQMFRECIMDLLMCLLRWPTQSLFVETAKCGWRFLNTSDCSTVLLAIIYKIRDASRDYDYSQLFLECWRLCPAGYAPRLLDNVTFLDRPTLLLTKGEEFIRLIMNDAPLHQIEAFVSHRHDKIFRVFICESFISEAALMACKETAALNSENAPEDEEKRLRSEHVSRLVDLAMEERIMIRRL